MCLNGDEECLFRFVQRLVLASGQPMRPDRLRKLWDHTFTLVYEEAEEGGAEAGGPGREEEQAGVPELLELLCELRALSPVLREGDCLSSEKLRSKLAQQMADPLVMSTRAAPDWCERLMRQCGWLFPFPTRQLYLQVIHQSWCWSWMSEEGRGC